MGELDREKGWPPLSRKRVSGSRRSAQRAGFMQSQRHPGTEREPDARWRGDPWELSHAPASGQEWSWTEGPGRLKAPWTEGPRWTEG